MTTLTFTTNIKATKETVWDNLWNDKTYREWTAAFMEGSYAESDWNEGSKIAFLSPKGAGMFGIIEKKIPNQQMSFKHLGEIVNGVEEKKDWGGATENYYLQEKDGSTELKVTMDATPDFAAYLNVAFPNALETLKHMSEK